MLEQARTTRPLSRRDALDLMARASIGRVVVTEHALPAVHPVAYVLDGEHVLFRAPADSPLAVAARDTVVAFQVDDIDVEERTGWTCTAIGHSRAVADGADPTRSAHSAAPAQICFRMTTELVTGYLIRRQDP
jgi:nitroimidazol reductase NimA-like FMN-containing flavoprotein (pyridoxamine 5'-phosphate oxidase superfamily)